MGHLQVVLCSRGSCTQGSSYDRCGRGQSRQHLPGTVPAGARCSSAARRPPTGCHPLGWCQGRPHTCGRHRKAVYSCETHVVRGEQCRAGWGLQPNTHTHTCRAQLAMVQQHTCQGIRAWYPLSQETCPNALIALWPRRKAGGGVRVCNRTALSALDVTLTWGDGKPEPAKAGAPSGAQRTDDAGCAAATCRGSTTATQTEHRVGVKTATAFVGGHCVHGCSSSAGCIRYGAGVWHLAGVLVLRHAYPCHKKAGSAGVWSTLLLEHSACTTVNSRVLDGPSCKQLVSAQGHDPHRAHGHGVVLRAQGAGHAIRKGHQQAALVGNATLPTLHPYQGTHPDKNSDTDSQHMLQWASTSVLETSRCFDDAYGPADDRGSVNRHIALPGHVGSADKPCCPSQPNQPKWTNPT